MHTVCDAIDLGNNLFIDLFYQSDLGRAADSENGRVVALMGWWSRRNCFARICSLNALIFLGSKYY